MGTRKLKRAAGAVAVAAGLAIAGACGSSSPASSSSTSPTGVCTPSSSPTTFVIQSNQICPKTMTVSRGTQVTILNSDSVAHEMNSDPHPEHTDCPELNQIGHLEPSQSRQSGNLNIARTCGFHDHLNPDNNGMKGTITIQ